MARSVAVRKPAPSLPALTLPRMIFHSNPSTVDKCEVRMRLTGFDRTCLFLCVHKCCRGRQRGAGARGGPVPAAPGAQGNQRRPGAGRGTNPAPTNFPAQQRAPGDPAVVARGNSLYGIHCRVLSWRGSSRRRRRRSQSSALGPRAQRSEWRVDLSCRPRRTSTIRGCRQCRRCPMSQDDVKAIAEYIHSVAATAQRQGGPPPGPPLTLNILVGDAAAGKDLLRLKMQLVPLRDRRPERYRHTHHQTPCNSRIHGLPEMEEAAGAATMRLRQRRRSRFRTVRRSKAS